MYSTVPEFSVSVILEVIKLVIIMCGIFNFKIKEDKKWILISLGSGSVLTVLFYILNGFWTYNYGLNPLTMLITAMIMVAVLVTGKKKLLMVLISEFTVSSIDELIHYYVCKLFDASYNNSFYILTTSLSIIILTVPACIVRTRKKKKNGLEYPVEKMSTFYLSLLVISQFVLLYYTGILHEYTGINRQIINICILFIIATELGMFFIIGRKDYYHNLSVINEKMLDVQEKYYMKLLDHEDEIRKFRHDVNNHIISLEALLEEGKLEESKKYLSEIKGAYPLVKSVVRTGNTIVSAIASDYAERFPEVTLEWEGLFPDELTISNTDICTIFSNVLGNAFENADKSEKEKIVSANVKTVTNSMIVTVKNTIGAPVKMKDGVFETSKDDKENHGIGTINIQKSVKANDGIVEYNYDESMFEIRIILPNALKVF